MTGLYIHIPFCKKKCNYCDFLSYAGKEDEIDTYVEELVKELKALSSNYTTIYIGGGTPTLLTVKHLEQILNVVQTFRSASEITIEANPGTANKAKLQSLHDLGANRLSIGAQSFANHHLKTLGRIHNAEEIFRIYEDARTVGFNNINLDLIFALPNQTLKEWKQDLQTAIELGPEHLSCYSLQIEEGTPLYEKIKQQKTNNKQFQKNKFQLPNEDEELEMYEYTIEALTKSGYKHYEISNFTKPGFECKHNINYWKMGKWIGIGTGAKSSPQNDQRNTIFMGLRMLEGLPTEKFHGFEKEVAELIENGLLMQKNGNYKLTRKGLYLGNLVFEKFV